MRQGATLLHAGSVAVAALLWSTSFAVTKIVLPHVGELALGAIRFLAAAALLLIICLASRTSLNASWRTHTSVAIAGLVGISLYFAFENYGVALATATDAVLIVASYPVMTMLAESVLHRSRPEVINILGAIIAFIGVFLVTIDKPAEEASHRPLGILLLLLGGIAWTIYNLILTYKQSGTTQERQLKVLPTTALQNLWGGIGFCLLLPLFPDGAKFTLSETTIWLIAYLTAGCSALAFLLYTFGLTALKPSQAVGILNLVPVFGVIWACVIADESITILKTLGAATVTIGVAMNTKGPSPSKQNRRK